MVLNSAELSKYFCKDQTPKEMKEKILAALDKQYPPKQLEAAKGEKSPPSKRNSSGPVPTSGQVGPNPIFWLGGYSPSPLVL